MSKHKMSKNEKILFTLRLVNYFPLISFLDAIADIFLSIYFAGQNGFVFSEVVNDLFDPVVIVDARKVRFADVLVEMGYLIKNNNRYFLSEDGKKLVLKCFEEESAKLPALH